MKRTRELRKLLGRNYSYKRILSDREIMRLKNKVPEYFAESVVASLTAGCMKIEAVLFRGSCGLVLGYDVFVKDDLASPEWICYDSPMDEVILKEKELLAVLDRIVNDNHLSYTECCFERLKGKEFPGRRKKVKDEDKQQTDEKDM